ncbi:MAG: cyclase family protein [Acidimicrobiia bacterium]
MGAHFVDLSHTVEHDMLTYSGLPAPLISDHLTRQASRARYAPGTEFHIGRIDMVGNTGTYLDTPFHRYADGFDLADLPLAAVADLPGLVVPATDSSIGPEAVADLHVRGRAVLFRTGWDRHWGTETYGGGGQPFLTAAAVEGLVRGGAALVGIDSINVDDTSTGDRPVHSGLLAAGIPVVEHLCRLDQITTAEFRFFAVPVKVKGLGTFPVRAFAMW